MAATHTRRRRRCSIRTGRYAISDSAWAMHLLGLQERCPSTRYVSMTGALPMLRAVKDAEEIERLAAAGAAADAALRGDPERALRRPQGDARSPPTSPSC